MKSLFYRRSTRVLTRIVGALFMVGTGVLSTQTPAHANTSYFRFTNSNSGKCLDITGVSLANNAPAQQYTCLGDSQANQLFELVYVSGSGLGNRYKLIAKHSGKCLDVDHGYTTDGATILQYTCNGSNNQLWILTPYDLNNLRYWLRPESAMYKCADVSFGSTANGASILQYEMSVPPGGPIKEWQLWKMTEVIFH